MAFDEVFYTYKAAEQLKNLPRSVQKRIIEKMRFYAIQENPLKFAERLTDYREGKFRFRVRDYRVIFDVKKILFIFSKSENGIKLMIESLVTMEVEPR